MQHEVLDPVGARVTGLSVAAPEPGDVDALKALLAEHGVLVLPGQEVDDEEFVAFLRGFGELTFTVGETPVDGHPDLNVVSNVGRTTPPRSSWHVDTSYVARPPAYTALRAVDIPDEGGETLFTSQYRACDTLPPALREQVEGRSARHVVTGLDLGPDEETEAEHPLLRPHPVTGRTALYLSSAQRLASVSGLPDDEAADLVAGLLEHSTRDDNVLRHSWSPGDVVVWDNSAVLHKADHAGVVGDRVLHRGMVAWY